MLPSRVNTLRGLTRRIPAIPLTVVAIFVAFGLTASQAGAAVFTESAHFGGAGSGPGEFAEQRGLAVDQSDGHVFVADKENHRVQEFEASGTFVGEITGGETPEGASEFAPVQVAVNSATHVVYVFNGETSAVDEFEPAGATSYKYVGQVKGSETPEGTGFAPSGIAVDPSTGKLEVVDGEAGHVDVFSAAGTYESQFGSGPGSGAGQFSEEARAALAISASGDAYVLDGANHRVQEFDASGAFVSTVFTGSEEEAQPTQVAVNTTTGDVYIGLRDSKGGAEGYKIAVYEPNGTLVTSFGATSFNSSSQIEGLAVYATTGDVYVSEYTTSQVDIFSESSSTFTESAHFGGAGSGPGEFAEQRGLAVDQSDGHVFVADKENHRVQEFEASGTFVGEITGGETPEGALEFAPVQVAVDSSTHELYVFNGETSAIDEFEATGAAAYKYAGQVKGSETPEGTGFAPSGIGVDPSTGNVEVVDGEAGHVDVFNPSGTYKTQFGGGPGSGAGEFSEEARAALAISASGDAYVLDGANHRVQEFDASGAFVSTVFTGSEEEAQPTQVAVNTTTGDVYIGLRDSKGGAEGYKIAVYEPNGTLVTSFGATSFNSSSQIEGLAVYATTGDVYVSEYATSQVDIFSESAGACTPTVTANGSAGKVTPYAASLTAKFSDHQGCTTSSYFQYGTTAAYGSRLSPHTGLAGSGEEPVSAQLSGLEPATTYHFQLVVSSGRVTVHGEDETFTTPTLSVATGLAGMVSQTSATIVGTMNPAGEPLTYEFQYGTTVAYGASTGSESAGTGTGTVRETASLTGLAPATTYHYRLLATNAAGRIFYGEDETFMTYPMIPGNSSQALSVGQSGTELTSPASPPLLPTLTPTRPAPSSTTSKPKTATRAEKLSKALKQCKRYKNKAKRKSCDRSAHKRFGPKHKRYGPKHKAA